jgi:hypothetical protein
LESLHRNLFTTQEIRCVTGARGLEIGNVKDLDLDESDVINATTGEFRSIGTKGLSTCIAICVRGQNACGDQILGLHHYSGCADAGQVFADIDNKMRSHGSPINKYYLVGGMILSEESGMGSYQTEKELLSLRDRYDIRGAKLHPLEGEYGPKGEENMISVVVSPEGIYFSKMNLYRSE